HRGGDAAGVVAGQRVLRHGEREGDDGAGLRLELDALLHVDPGAGGLGGNVGGEQVEGAVGTDDAVAAQELEGDGAVGVVRHLEEVLDDGARVQLVAEGDPAVGLVLGGRGDAPGDAVLVVGGGRRDGEGHGGHGDGEGEDAADQGHGRSNRVELGVVVAP